MAEEVEMISVADMEPPKADPLTKSAATVKLSPVVRKPVIGGAPKPGIAPGLKIPPKPGIAPAPKPGIAPALKPGLKLPTQAALKPGLKLPPKPVIHKPGEAVAASPLPKPMALPKPVEASKPAEASKPMETLKSVTQKLKGVTQEIPQQAVLHKTGIIAESGLSDAQKEAAKHKTARISLSDAMGVAPVKDEAAPMKTIRIKRPVDISTAASAAPAAPAAAASDPTVTQRKTLKVTRPSGVAVRPGGKFSIKRPGQTAVDSPAAAAPADPATEGTIADIPDMSTTSAAPVPHAVPVADSPSWVWTLSAIVQLAACAAIGALAWFLYQNAQLPTFCGGLGWGA